MNVMVKNEIQNIKEQIVQKFDPKKIILFGSQVKGTCTKHSDIDLCIIKNTDNKRELIAEIYLSIESSKPYDVLVYTEQEWEDNVRDKASFAYLINKSGVEIYGR